MGPRLAERLRHGESGLDDGVEAGVEREGVEVRVGGLEVVLEVGGAAIDEIFHEIAGTSREEGDGRGGEMEVTGGEAEGRAGPAVGGDVVGEGSAEELGLETLGGARGLLVHPGVGGRGAATPRRGGRGKRTGGREGGREEVGERNGLDVHGVVYVGVNGIIVCRKEVHGVMNARHEGRWADDWAGKGVERAEVICRTPWRVTTRNISSSLPPQK